MIDVIIFWTVVIAVASLLVFIITNQFCHDYNNPVFDSGPQKTRGFAFLILLISMSALMIEIAYAVCFRR